VSQEDVDVVRSCIEAWRLSDYEESLSYWAEDGIWQSAGVDGTTYRGHAGVTRAMEEWTGAFSDYWLESDDLIDAGDGRVVMLWREGGRGRTSGVPVEEQGSTVFTIENGKIAYAHFYDSKAEALEVCGLSPR
jgi:ketosteroid isomerase-like protein